MDNTLIVEPTTEEKNLQRGIQQTFAEIEQIRTTMQRDQAQIEASGKRTDVMLQQIQAQLTLLKARRT